MQCCDRCKQQKPIIIKFKIKGKNFELCSDCSECVSNYIQFSFQEKTGLSKLGDMFK